jgi:hypothetical protein
MNKLQKICFLHWKLDIGLRNEGPLTPNRGQPHLKMGAYFSPMTCGEYPINLVYPSNCIEEIFDFSWKIQIWVPRLGYPHFQTVIWGLRGHFVDSLVYNDLAVKSRKKFSPKNRFSSSGTLFHLWHQKSKILGRIRYVSILQCVPFRY